LASDDQGVFVPAAADIDNLRKKPKAPEAIVPDSAALKIAKQTLLARMDAADLRASVEAAEARTAAAAEFATHLRRAVSNDPPPAPDPAAPSGGVAVDAAADASLPSAADADADEADLSQPVPELEPDPDADPSGQSRLYKSAFVTSDEEMQMIGLVAGADDAGRGVRPLPRSCPARPVLSEGARRLVVFLLASAAGVFFFGPARGRRRDCS
jgi:hypothetical protein